MTKDYNAFFKELGLRVMPLNDDYDPDIFGRELMKDSYENSGVLYSSSISECEINAKAKSGHEKIG